MIKLKLKRSKFVEITPENLVDIKEVLCIKDLLVAESYDKSRQYKVEKGKTYKFKRRSYNWGSDPKIGDYFELRGLGYWQPFYFKGVFAVLDWKDCLRGKLINRRKKKNENQGQIQIQTEISSDIKV